MYKIEKTDYGLHLVISGLLSVDEIEKFVDDIRDFTIKAEGPFSMLCDVRKIVTPPEEIMALFMKSQLIVKEKLLRMAMVVSSPVVFGLAKQLSFQSGLNDVTQFISSLKTDDWEKACFDWILEGIKPEQGEINSASQKIHIEQFK